MEKVAATLLFLLYLTSAQQERCGTIGNGDETAATASRAELFYLDTEHPANCTGNITSWRVCYYGPNDVDNSGAYWATYAVYRRMGSGSSVSYVRVSEMFRAVRAVERLIVSEDSVVDGEITQRGFNCYYDTIDAGDSPLTVQAGDILGACVFDPDDRRFLVTVTRLPLDVVGEASGESLLLTDTGGCSMDTIPSDIPANQLSTLNSRRLHIYANIENEPTTTGMVSTPSISTATVTTTVQKIAKTTEPTTATNPLTTQASQTSVPTEFSPTTTDLLVATSVTEVETTVSESTPEGSQAGRVVAIVAGSAGGGLLLLLLLVVIVSSIVGLTLRKWKVYDLSADQTTVENSSDDKIDTNTNVAYKPVLHNTTTINAEFGILHGTTEPQQSAENGDSKLNMEQNVAYASSNTAQISLASNVAYYKSGKPLEENYYENDQTEDYDYI